MNGNTASLPDWITASAGVLAVGGVWYAIRTLRFNGWLRAQEIFTDKHFAAARGRIFKKELPATDAELKAWLNDNDAQLSKEEKADKRAASLVCWRLDELAHLMQMPGLHKRRAQRVWDIAFSKALVVLERYVKRRQNHDHDPGHWRAFMSVAEQALKRTLKRTGPPWEELGTHTENLGRRTRVALKLHERQRTLERQQEHRFISLRPRRRRFSLTVGKISVSVGLRRR